MRCRFFKFKEIRCLKGVCFRDEVYLEVLNVWLMFVFNLFNLRYSLLYIQNVAEVKICLHVTSFRMF